MQRDQHFDDFRDHTRLKHFLLVAYLKVLQSPSFFGKPDATRVVSAQTLHAQQTAGRESGRHAQRILDTALGSNQWATIIRNTPRASRRQRFVDLYRELLQTSGAHFTLAFRVESDAGQHKYHLVHASKHARAFVAMKEAMHSTRRKREAAQEALQLVALLTENDIVAIVDQIGSELAGRTVRWSDGRKESVRKVAIERTALWLHECDALKAELERRGWGRMSGKAQTFEFPPT